MAGNSGYVDFEASNYGGAQTMRVFWQEQVSDAPGATSTITVTDIKLATNTYFGWTYYASMLIKINGVVAVNLGIEDGNSVYPVNSGEFYSVTRGGNLITGSVSGVAHDAQGNKTVDITIEPNDASYAGFWRAWAPFQFTTTSIAKAIALYQIPVGVLSISAATGSTISATRAGSVLLAGANLWYGQSLVITFGATTGYALTAHTVNGSTFPSGGTHTVTGNVAVAATASRSISTISTGNGTFGVEQTIIVTQYISTAKHTIRASCAGQTQTIATKASSLSISWIPDINIMNSITAALSAACVLTIDTFDANDNYLGSSSITITLALPTSGQYSVLPTPAIQDSDVNGYAATFGSYVAGKSSLRVTITDGLKFSATAASRSSSANGVSSGASSFSAGILTANTTISTAVKDSRGQTGTASKSVSVLAYTAPSILAFAARRVNASGTPDDTGDYFAVSWQIAVTALNDKNTRTLKIRYKQTSAYTWTEITVPLSAYTQSGTTGPVAASGDYSWDIEIGLSDAFETVIKATKLSTAATVESRLPDGSGVAFGKVAEIEDTLDVAWNMRLHGSLDLAGDVVEMYEPSTGETEATAFAKLSDLYDAMPERASKRVWVANNWGIVRGLPGGQAAVELIKSGGGYGMMVADQYWSTAPQLIAVCNAGVWGDFMATLTASGGTVSGPLTLAGGSTVHDASGTGGTAGFVRVATITVTGPYANVPITLSFARRRDSAPTTLSITFLSAANTDPGLAYFTGIGPNPGAAQLAKRSASIWDLYVEKTEPYDRIAVTDYHLTAYMQNLVSLTWTDEQAGASPGGTAASPAQMPGTAALQNRVYGTTLTVAVGRDLHGLLLTDVSSLHLVWVASGTIRTVEVWNGGNTDTLTATWDSGTKTATFSYTNSHGMVYIGY